MILHNPGRVVHKSRSKPTITAICPASESVNSSGQVTGTFGGGMEVLVYSHSEDIVYTTKPKGLRHASNVCVHTKLTEGYAGGSSLPYQRVDNLVIPGHYTRYYNGHQHQQIAHASAVSAAEAAFSTQFGSGFLGANGQTLINDAWKKAKPDLTTMSLPNFLLEFKDVKKMANKWLTGKGLRSTVRQAGKQRASKTLAGGVLEYSFGLAPTISDVSAMINAVRNTQQRVSQFCANVGKPMKARLLMHKATTGKQGTFDYEGDSHQPCSWNGTLDQRTTAHFTFVGKAPAVLSNLDRTLRAMLDSFGVELNPRIIWDALPFSFIIDWIINVGDILERFKVDAMELPVDIVDSCLQYTESRAISSNLTLDKGSSTSSINHWPTHATLYRRFQRMPIAPTFEVLQASDVQMPSARQITLGFSLIVANAGGGSSRVTSSNVPSTKTISAIPFGNIAEGLLIS